MALYDTDLAIVSDECMHGHMLCLSINNTMVFESINHSCCELNYHELNICIVRFCLIDPLTVLTLIEIAKCIQTKLCRQNLHIGIACLN